MSETKNVPNYRIVVGIGFTDACAQAVTQAFALASKIPGTEVHFATALDHMNVGSASQLAKGEERLIETEGKLVKFVREVASNADARKSEVPVVYHVRIGKPVDSLVQVGVDVDADLLVVGTRQRTRAAKLLLGSVAEALLAEARFPVLVAHARDTTGLTKTPRPDPRRPGEALTENRDGVLTSSERVDWGSRRSHISGLL